MLLSQTKAEYLGDVIDDRPGDYFISAIDGDQFAFASGPYASHSAALAELESVKRQTCQLDPGAWFYAFGTCRLEPGSDRRGVLQLRGLRDAPEISDKNCATGTNN